MAGPDKGMAGVDDEDPSAGTALLDVRNPESTATGRATSDCAASGGNAPAQVADGLTFRTESATSGCGKCRATSTSTSRLLLWAALFRRSW